MYELQYKHIVIKRLILAGIERHKKHMLAGGRYTIHVSDSLKHVAYRVRQITGNRTNKLKQDYNIV